MMTDNQSIDNWMIVYICKTNLWTINSQILNTNHYTVITNSGTATKFPTILYTEL